MQNRAIVFAMIVSATICSTLSWRVTKLYYDEREASAQLEVAGYVASVNAERLASAVKVAALQSKIEEIDSVAQTKLAEAKRETANYRACISDGKCGLYVKAGYSTNTATSPGTARDGASLGACDARRLDTDAEQNYLDLTDRMRQQRVQIETLIDIVKRLQVK